MARPAYERWKEKAAEQEAARVAAEGLRPQENHWRVLVDGRVELLGPNGPVFTPRQILRAVRQMNTAGVFAEAGGSPTEPPVPEPVPSPAPSPPPP